jgi:hypothetical protein
MLLVDNDTLSDDDIENILSIHGLAIPSSKYIKTLRKKTLEYDLTQDQVDGAVQLLHHQERDFIDALCVLYKATASKVLIELSEYDIVVDKEVLDAYITLFWNPTAIGSRPKWNVFLKRVDDYDLGTTTYKNLLSLAKMGDEELLFWKMKRPKPRRDRQEILEETAYDAAMRLKESQCMPLSVDTAKTISALGQVLISSYKLLSDLENQTKYSDVLDTLRKGLIKIDNDLPENKVSRQDIINDIVEDTGTIAEE